MKELVEYIAKALATKPEEVRVTEVVEDERIIVRLEVAEEDKGKIIGKQGRVAQARVAYARVAERNTPLGAQARDIIAELDTTGYY
ncbi:MAG: KH domain-containing protein [Candidatus Latescibacteria bacterium]|nr:KH domain-containing protein [Candidatus Latescibacterota bacterium]